MLWRRDNISIAGDVQCCELRLMLSTVDDEIVHESKIRLAVSKTRTWGSF